MIKEHLVLFLFHFSSRSCVRLLSTGPGGPLRACPVRASSAVSLGLGVATGGNDRSSYLISRDEALFFASI